MINMIMWLIFGAAAGWIAGKIMGNNKGGLLRNIVIGIIGSMVGGMLASFIGISARSFSLGGLLIAVIGACVCLSIGRKLFK